MHSIRIWLNGERNYAAGVKLYNLFGKDKLLKKLFASPNVTDYNRRRLEEVLEEILDQAEKPGAEKAAEAVKAVPLISTDMVAAADRKSGIKGTTGWSEVMDEVESALYNSWRPVYDELMNLSARVGDIAKAGQKDPAKKIEAGKMALRILDLDDQCDEFYSQRSYYLQNRQLPEKFPYGEPCLDPKQYAKKLANAERYIRDYQLKLKNDPGDVKSAEALKKHQWFVAYYKKQLNID